METPQRQDTLNQARAHKFNATAREMAWALGRECTYNEMRDAREIGVGPTLNSVPHRTFGFGRPTASDRPV